MRKTIIKVICLILLIPLLGFGLLFGGAYIYGNIRYAEKKATVVLILDAHENELLEIIEDDTTDTKRSDLLKPLLGLVKTGSVETPMLEQLGFEKLIQSENTYFFQLPYDGRLGSWVPCGLLYNNDLSTIEP